MNCLYRWVVSVAVWLTCVSQSLAQPVNLIASDVVLGDEFGRSVFINGTTAVIGAPLGDGVQADSGAAYVFECNGNTCVQVAKLTASDGLIHDTFGFSVAIQDDTVVIGARFDDDAGNRSGSAYVFERPPGGWADMTESAKLTASDGAERDRFGHSVAISGDTIVIGAFLDDDAGSNSGSVYVFEKPPGGWVDMIETAKLTPSDGAAGDRFGDAVGIRGDTIVIGAPFDDDPGRDSGSAYVFEKPPAGWAPMTETIKFSASDTTAGDEFGLDVSISGSTVVIGAPGSQDGGDCSGSAYVFEKPIDGWMNGPAETAKLTASDRVAAAIFGRSVSVSGSTIIIGAPRDDDLGPESGAAYLYRMPPGGWMTTTETSKVTASNGVAGDRFGKSVSHSGQNLVIGIDRSESSGMSAGAAFAYEIGTLIRIVDGLGGINRATGLADTFISPLSEDFAFTKFSLEASEPLTLDGAKATYTGPEPTPGATITFNRDGQHTLLLDPAPVPGEWLKLDLDIRGQITGFSSTLTVWLAHLPLDVTQDGIVDIRDATAFADEFNGRAAPELVDLNGDGEVNARDATAFGDNWVGRPPATRAWGNVTLPDKPR